MFIHYFIIQYGFIVVFSSTINRSIKRIRRDFLNNEDNINLYGVDYDNGRYFRNQQEEIDRDYYQPIKRKFKMSNLLSIA